MRRTFSTTRSFKHLIALKSKQNGGLRLCLANSACKVQNRMQSLGKNAVQVDITENLVQKFSRRYTLPLYKDFVSRMFLKTEIIDLERQSSEQQALSLRKPSFARLRIFEKK